MQFYGKTAINISASEEKNGIGKAIYGESNHGKSNYGKSNHGKSVQGTRNSWFGQEELDSERNGYGERLRDKTELTEEAEAIEETEMEGQLVQKYQTARWEEAVRHVLLFLPEVLVYLGSFLLFWENEVLAKVVGVFEFYGRENAVRRQWEREEKEEKKENLEGKQRNSKNRTALDTQKRKRWTGIRRLQCCGSFMKKKGTI